MERIMTRAAEGNRADDNFQTALQRLRTYHKYHKSTIQFLREQHVPIVELDCSVTPEIGNENVNNLIFDAMSYGRWQFVLMSKNCSFLHTFF